MQELERALNTEIQDPSIDGKDLNEAGIKWASHALRNFVGSHLSKALEISRAIAEYTAWFGSDSQSKD